MIRYHARHVIPITSPPLRDATVAVADGRIAYVGARHAAPPGVDVELGDAILMPGLVNAHTHLELTAMRGFLEDLDFRQWILRLTTSKRALLTREMLLDSARYGVAEGLRRGITTYADTCDSGVAFDAMRECGVRGVMFQEVFGPDPAQCAASLAELRGKIDRLRPLETPLVRVGVSPHAPYTVSDALYRAVAAYARAEGLPVAVHIAESDAEEQLVVSAAGAFADGLRGRGITVERRAASPVQLLDRLGLLAAHPLLIHCVRVDSRDIASIAASGCPVAHCPASNAKLGHGIAPVVEMLSAGVTVALGSDSVASNNRMDLLEEARLAVLLQRIRGASPAAPPAAIGLRLATIDGARALGCERDIGSLEVGKSADLAAFRAERLAPTPDAEVAALFALAGTDASLVTVAGHELVREGRLLHEDPTIDSRMEQIGLKLREWESTGAPLGPLPTR